MYLEIYQILKFIHYITKQLFWTEVILQPFRIGKTVFPQCQIDNIKDIFDKFHLENKIQ